MALPENPVSDSGFSIIELLIVLLTVGIIATFTLMSITQARSSFVFSNSLDKIQSYLEMAASDSRRRKAMGDERARVKVLSPTSYSVTIDTNGDGTPETLKLNLPAEIKFAYKGTDPPQATIDWRGRVAEGNVSFVLQSSSGAVSEVRLTSLGDAIIDGILPVLPSGTETPTSEDINQSAALVGNNSPNPNPSPTPTPTPLPICANKQYPEADNCRCKPGKNVNDKGECK